MSTPREEYITNLPDGTMLVRACRKCEELNYRDARDAGFQHGYLVMAARLNALHCPKCDSPSLELEDSVNAVGRITIMGQVSCRFCRATYELPNSIFPFGLRGHMAVGGEYQDDQELWEGSSNER